MQAPGGVWQEGCLVKTCNSGTVEEGLADECVELIEKKVEKILGDKLAEKGWSPLVTKVTNYLVFTGIECPAGGPTEAGKYQTPGKRKHFPIQCYTMLKALLYIVVCTSVGVAGTALEVVDWQ